ncbi:hypothetical protein HID58_035503 [Brassica napus]|uniref:Yippee domain-containing protein n=1 Tax=Brassica napus TaxID=3708 RepID=A0ABQ8C527_BRANA|nr:hypothetical protein HID58_035503 [Brassica napus]
MGRVFIVDLEGQIYSCKHCNTHLTKEQDIMSKSFQCRYGQAYLFNEVVNISTGNEEDRMLMTGLHTVTAHDINQKYKEGKSVLELYKIVGPYDSNDLKMNKISHLPEALLVQILSLLPTKDVECSDLTMEAYLEDGA